MKSENYKFVVILFISLFTFNFWGKLYAEGYDSTLILSIKQKFAIPEDVYTGDHVGIWQKAYSWRSGNTISFSIKNNFKSAFSINSVTGLISVSDASQINGKIKQQDTIINLVIRTTDSKLGFEDDTCEIRVKENKYSVFIDYSYTTGPDLSANYYVSIDGNDNNSGTYASPFKTIEKAWSLVTAGQKIYVRGGLYPVKDLSSEAALQLSGKSGTKDNYIKIWAYPGERVIIDCTGQTYLGAHGIIIGQWANSTIANYIHIKGFEVKNVPQVIKNKTTGEGSPGIGIRSFADNVIIEQCITHHIGGPGIIFEGSNGQIINCDSYANYDPYTWMFGSPSPGDNADGIGVYGINNVVSGCRAWNNSDDGFDFFGCNGLITINNNWAYKNGYLENGNIVGNGGNGFKLGKTNSTSSIWRKVTNCMAVLCKSEGYMQNEALCGMELYNNISYGMGVEGFSFSLNAPITIKNCISYNDAQIIYAPYSIHSNNSWDSGVTANSADFQSLDYTQLLNPRKGDGSLPDVTFLKLVTNSDLINAGTNVGFGTNLGPFSATPVSSDQGSRLFPLKDLSETIVKAGFGYFIKRGNTPLKKNYDILGVQATVNNPTIISTYDAGNNPVFNGSGLSVSDEAFDFKNNLYPSKYVSIYNLDIVNYPSTAVSVKSKSFNFGFYNCNFSNNVRVDYSSDLADIYLFGNKEDSLINYHHELINIQSSGSWGPVLKSDASGIKAYNIKASSGNTLSSKATNFNFSNSYNSSLMCFWFIGGSRSIQVRSSNITITDGFITNSKMAGIFLVSDSSFNVWKINNVKISNVLLKRNENGIVFFSSGINKSLIENSRIELNTYDGIHLNSAGTERIIQNCSFYDNGSDGIELKGVLTGGLSSSFVYNIFSGNKGKDINGSNAQCADFLKIYNNTATGAIDLSGTTNSVVRNNFYGSIVGGTTVTNNILLTSISPILYFGNPLLRNYRLLNTAVNAIDKGINVGLNRDCISMSINSLPDIGAYEFAGTRLASNNPPIINDQKFTINESQYKNNWIGKIIATDKDSGQVFTYSVINGNEKGLFILNSSTGVINGSSIQFGTDTLSYILNVSVTDDGVLPATSYGKINIILVPTPKTITNHQPVIQPQSFRIIEGQLLNNSIGKIFASDIDNNQALTFSISSGGNGKFSIDPLTGFLKVFSSEGLFSKDSIPFQLVIKVTDNGTPSLNVSSTVNVMFVKKVETKNFPPAILDQKFVFYVNEVANGYIGKIIASDPNSEQKLLFSIVGGNESELFKVNTETGELSISNSNNITLNSRVFELKVKVTDNNSFPESSLANISINFIANRKNNVLLNVYPNPSKGNVNLELNIASTLNKSASLYASSKTAQIEVIDTYSKVIKLEDIEYEGSDILENLDLNDVPNGLYIINLKCSNMIYSKKLIISK